MIVGLCSGRGMGSRSLNPELAHIEVVDGRDRARSMKQASVNSGGGRCSPGLARWPMFSRPELTQASLGAWWWPMFTRHRGVADVPAPRLRAIHDFVPRPARLVALRRASCGGSGWWPRVRRAFTSALTRPAALGARRLGACGYRTPARLPDGEPSAVGLVGALLPSLDNLAHARLVPPRSAPAGCVRR